LASLRYAVISPVRDEAENLARLADALARQTRLPEAWVVVDTGSSDETPATVATLQATYPWIVAETSLVSGEAMRGGPVVQAFHAGLRVLPDPWDVVAKVDADTTVEPDYFDRLIGEFERDDRLGIAGGIAYELEPDGIWRQRHSGGTGVWGASRAYRRECLEEILPLEERMGWDTLDLASASVRGWGVRVLPDLPFRHHRKEGSRESSRFKHWVGHGNAAHYMGYRPSYLAIRTVYRMFGEPSAIGIGVGYVFSALRREPRCQDRQVTEYLRAEQSLRRLPLRMRQARRAREALGE
jgi:poly-beta-1,6-N-acetyl-D-glucosamine synthase